MAAVFLNSPFVRCTCHRPRSGSNAVLRRTGRFHFGSRGGRESGRQWNRRFPGGGTAPASHTCPPAAGLAEPSAEGRCGLCRCLMEDGGVAVRRTRQGRPRSRAASVGKRSRDRTCSRSPPPRKKLSSGGDREGAEDPEPEVRTRRVQGRTPGQSPPPRCLAGGLTGASEGSSPFQLPPSPVRSGPWLDWKSQEETKTWAQQPAIALAALPQPDLWGGGQIGCLKKWN